MIELWNKKVVYNLHLQQANYVCDKTYIKKIEQFINS